MSVERLGWDSDFFGFAIGRATPGLSLNLIADEAADLELACVYIEVRHPIDPQRHDLRLVDRRVLLGAPITARAASHHVRPIDAADVSLLGPVLDRLAPWSRFSRDPGFGVAQARRMYDAWLHRALTSTDERVGVIADVDEPAGFVTVRLGANAEIGLLGATTDGSGAGQRLIDWAFGAASSSRVLEVVTQGDNARALALYERNGFMRKAESLMYHLWLNDEESNG